MSQKNKYVYILDPLYTLVPIGTYFCNIQFILTYVNIIFKCLTVAIIYTRNLVETII